MVTGEESCSPCLSHPTGYAPLPAGWPCMPSPNSAELRQSTVSTGATGRRSSSMLLKRDDM